MKKFIKIVFLLFMYLGLTEYAMGLTTYYESYEGKQLVSGGDSYNFGFDLWFDNDPSLVNTSSSLSLQHDASGLLPGETWYLAKLIIKFSSNTSFDATPYITINGWGDLGSNDNPPTVTTKTINPGKTNSFIYMFEGDLLTSFEQYVWGNVNIEASPDYPSNSFNIEKVAMQVVTLAPGETPPAPVPEPASMFLMGTGLAGLAAIRKRRNK